MGTLGSVIVGIVTAFIFMLVSKKAQRRRIEDDKLGNFTFRLPKFFLYFGIIMLVITVIFAILIPIQNNEDIFYSIILFGLFGIGGGLIVLFYNSYLVQINNSKISYCSTFKKETTIQWEEIDSIVHKPNRGKVVVSTKNKRIIIHQQVVGFDQIIELIEKYTGITKEKLKIK